VRRYQLHSATARLSLSGGHQVMWLDPLARLHGVAGREGVR
jgi:hypothetical protein